MLVSCVKYIKLLPEYNTMTNLTHDEIEMFDTQKIGA